MATTKVPEKCQKTQSQALNKVKGLNLRHLLPGRGGMYGPNQPLPLLVLYVMNGHTVWVLKSSLSHFKYGVGSTCLSYSYCFLDVKYIRI